MPKYLVERRFDVSVTSEGMPDVGTKSKRTIQEHFLGSIVWEHSHVLVDDEGRVTDVLRIRGAGPGHRVRTQQAARTA